MPATIRLNQQIEWACSGTSDTLTCSDLSQLVRNGVRCETDFSMATATVVVTLPSGITKTVTVDSANANCALIGDGFSMASITFSNVAAGTYTVRVSQ